MTKPRLAVSGCLLGEEIRYDGQHKRHPYIAQEISKLFSFESFCPEVAMGLGIPRATVQLRKDKDKIRIVESKNPDNDHTEIAHKTFKKLKKSIEGCHGIVLTKNSPSCGLDPVKVYHIKSGMPDGRHSGLFAQYLVEEFPRVPKIDSGRLFDDHLRETFISQVQIFYAFTKVKKAKELVKFQEQHKFYYMQYGVVHLRKLGQICAGVSAKNFSEKYEEYAEYLFETVFRKKVTRKHRTNVAEHMAGFLKNILSKSDKKYLKDSIMSFHSQKLSFESLLILIRYMVQSHNIEYLQNQKIFELYLYGK